MKQIIVITADRWIDGSGYETKGSILSREVVETDTPLTTENLEPVDEEDFGEFPENVDYMIREYIFNSEEDEANGNAYDETWYWLRG